MSCDECDNYKPKRKQTGFVCRQCSHPCVVMGRTHAAPGVGCHISCDRPGRSWVPFYGTVSE